MNVTAILMETVALGGVRDEGIAPGMKATWAHAPSDAKQEAALARAVGVANVTCSPLMPGHAGTQSELAQWIGKLESLSTLAPGWNRQGAPAPSAVAIRAARQFIESLVNDGQPPTRVAASAVGGVGVTRQVGERLAYIEFYNDGAACALLADDTGDERVLDVAPKGDRFSDLLEKLKIYLNG